MNKKNTTFTAIVAILIAFMAIFVPAISFADEPKPKGDKPGTCDEKLATCNSDLRLCQELVCPDGSKPVKPVTNPAQQQKDPPKPAPKPYNVTCGFGTTGGQPSVADKATGSRHCACENPAHWPVTGKFGATGKVEICLPGAGIAERLRKADPDIDVADLKKIVDAIKEKQEVDEKTLLLLGIDVEDLKKRMAAAEKKNEEQDGEIDAVKKRLDELEKMRFASSHLQLFGGVSLDLGSRNGFQVGGQLAGGLFGWPHPNVGLYTRVKVGLMHEPNDAAQVNPFLTVSGGIGPAFRFLDGHLVLGVGFHGRQTIRAQNVGFGVEDHFFGGQYGGEAFLSIQPSRHVPLAIVPGGNFGYGPVAGWVKGTPFQLDMVQGAFTLDIVFLTGIHFGEKKAK
jgi:hypothetical protein